MLGAHDGAEGFGASSAGSGCGSGLGSTRGAAGIAVTGSAGWAGTASAASGAGGTVFVAAGGGAGGFMAGRIFSVAAGAAEEAVVGVTLAGGATAGGTVAGGTVAGGTVAGETVAGGTVAGGSVAGGTVFAAGEAAPGLVLTGEPDAGASLGETGGLPHSAGVGPPGRSGSLPSASPNIDGGHAGIVCSVGGSAGQMSLCVGIAASACVFGGHVRGADLTASAGGVGSGSPGASAGAGTV